MPAPLDVGALRSVLHRLDRARPLPAAAFHAPDVLAWEREEIFFRDWLCVGREDEVAAPGAFVLARIFGEELIVIRGPDLRLRALFNVCRHRGSTLVTAPSGRVDALRCPYHGYTYDLTGRLQRSGPGVALASARVTAWGGFVFVSLLEDPEPLVVALGEIPRAIARLELGLLALAYRSEHEVHANWKLCVENFQESHHFPLVHPALEELTPSSRASSKLGEGPWLGGVMTLRGDVETVSLDGRRHGRPALPGATEEDQRRVHDFFLWPNALFSAQPDYLLCYRLWPLAPDRTRIVFEVLVHPETLQRPADELEPVRQFWVRVNAEDRAICERQQIGTASRVYRPLGYEPVEDGVHAFDAMIARRYLQT